MFRRSGPWLVLAALSLVATTAASLYCVVRIVAPQVTSQNYRDLSTGRLRVPPVIIIPSREGAPVDMNAYLESARTGAMSYELNGERRRGTLALVLWGGISVLGGLLFWRWKRSHAQIHSGAV
jgi:hypothetical protein